MAVQVDECSVLKNFKKLFSNDYKNSVVVGSVCLGARIQRTAPGQRWWVFKERNMVPDMDSHLPFALLGEEGWRKFDPFLPVEVRKVVCKWTDKVDVAAGGSIHRV